MRLSIVSYSLRRIGGIEQNLNVVLPELERRGHQIQFVYFHDEPASRAPIRIGPETQRVDAAAIGHSRALEKIADFRPDLINVHGDVDPEFQTTLLEIAPAAYSVHNYYGTCISGLKTTMFPVIQPCQRTFGPTCLLRYLPRQCGGRNPVTMIRRYRRERDRLAVISRYDAVITHTRQMEEEYRRHGLTPEQIHGLPYEVVAGDGSIFQADRRTSLADGIRLLFAGRMEKLKGGQVLIAALPELQRLLQKPIELHFAGDGPACGHWQQLAGEITAQDPAISVHFHGWTAGAALRRLFQHSHLLVVPSLWPEPFGKVGPEAGTYGLPAAAFDVGGIGEWLVPGVNGMLAPGNPPRVEGIVRAIVSCLEDPEVYQRLCEGARESIQRFDLHAHVDALIALFERLCRQRSACPEPALAQ